MGAEVGVSRLLAVALALALLPCVALADRHGAEAPIHAAMHAEAMLDRGDLDGQRVWVRILNADHPAVVHAMPLRATIVAIGRSPETPSRPPRS